MQLEKFNQQKLRDLLEYLIKNFDSETIAIESEFECEGPFRPHELYERMQGTDDGEYGIEDNIYIQADEFFYCTTNHCFDWIHPKQFKIFRGRWLSEDEFKAA